MAKSVLALLAVGATCVSLGYSGHVLHLRRSDNPPTSATEPARRVEADRVVALGRLEPHCGVISIAGPPGARIARIAVQEGQEVRRGETLVLLEGQAELMAEKPHLEAQIREAQDRLDAERRYEEVLKAEAKIERQQVEELEPREIQAQQAKLDLLRENLKNSTANLNRLEGLPKQAVVSQQEYDQCHLLVRRDQEELESAAVLLDKLKKAHEIHEERVDLEIRKAEVGSIRLQRNSHRLVTGERGAVGRPAGTARDQGAHRRPHPQDPDPPRRGDRHPASPPARRR